MTTPAPRWTPPEARCVTSDAALESFYPQSWSDAAIESYELERELDTVARSNREDATQATAKLNHLAESTPTPAPARPQL